MSFIQKLENSYVAILRVVIIIFATLLLLSAAALAFMSLKEKLGSNAAPAVTVKIDPNAVVNAVAPAKGADAPVTAKAADHKASFDKAYALVAPFVQKYSNGTETVNKEEFIATLSASFDRYDTPELQNAYLAGWIESMDASLKDKRIQDRAAKVSAALAKAAAAGDAPEATAESDSAAMAAEEDAAASGTAMNVQGVVDEISSAYSELFSAKYVEDIMKGDSGKSEKMGPMYYLIAAGSIFFSFLCLIFLTVTIRIERNLREMAYRPLVAEVRPQAV